MTPVFLLGLCGPAGCGKDHLTKVLPQAAAACGFGAVVTKAFSEPLYAWFRATFPHLSDHADAGSKERSSAPVGESVDSMRTLFEGYGDLVRGVDRRAFIRPVAAELGSVQRHRGRSTAWPNGILPSLFVVTDVRRWDEVSWLKNLGGHMLSACNPVTVPEPAWIPEGPYNTRAIMTARTHRVSRSYGHPHTDDFNTAALVAAMRELRGDGWEACSTILEDD